MRADCRVDRWTLWCKLTCSPQIVDPEHLRISDPALEGLSRCFSDLEANRLTRLALGDGGALLHPPCREDIPHLPANQVADAKFAVDGHIEQGKITSVVCHLEADTERPYMLRQQGALLADDVPFVLGWVFRPKFGQKIGGHGDTSYPQAHPDFG